MMVNSKKTNHCIFPQVSNAFLTMENNTTIHYLMTNLQTKKL